MSPSASLLLTAIAALLSRAPADAARDDRTQLQGTWKVVALEHGGKKKPAKKIAPLRVTVTGDKITSREGKEVLEESTFRLDAAATPRAIDLRFTAGPDAGKSARGIYRLDGKKLTLCVAEPGKDRPRQFKAAAGSGHTLFVLERITK